MTKIEFQADERDRLIDQIQSYFSDEMDQELGSFEAGFLLNFLVKAIGPALYNQALYDAQAILSARLETVSEAILDLEKR